MKKYLFICLVLTLFLAFAIAPESRAETYVAGYLGAAVPHEADTSFIVTGMGTVSGTVSFDPGFAIGGKVGYRFPLGESPTFLGIEMDLNVHFPDMTELSFSGQDFTVEADGTSLFITGNVLLGYNAGPVRPYAGGGIGAGSLRLSYKKLAGEAFTGEVDDSAFSWQILAGMDVPINSQFSVFAEYAYAATNLELVYIGETDEVDYRTSLIYGGLRYSY